MVAKYQVVNRLHDNEITTQRNISQRTGLSLDADNVILCSRVYNVMNFI